MQSSVRRRRRSFAFEPLENRLVLAAPVGVNDVYAVAEDQSISSLSQIFEANFNNANPPVITTGAAWNYLDRIQNEFGANQTYPVDSLSRPWNSPLFDASTSTIAPWGVANSPLQGGGIDAFPGAPATLTGIGGGTGGNNIATTYLFRRTISLTAAQAANTTGSLRWVCDDGCVVYVNGIEVTRQNLPTGTLTTNTFAPNVGNEASYTTTAITIPAGVLVAGNNTVAVEVHQNTATSSDIGFDLEMTLGAAGGSTEGFTYADDTFNTNNPNRAVGTYVESGGNTGGGLRVYLDHNPGGGGGGGGGAKSGAWVRTFNLPSAAIIDVSLRYRVTGSADNENTEYGEAVLTINGTRYGNGPNNSLARVVGDGNGGPIQDTGWQIANLSIPLAAGDHILRIGGYNNSTSVAGEWIEVFFDDVIIGGGTGAAGVLANDTDADGDPLTAEKLTDPANGTLLFNSDGTFVYTPNPNFFGIDTFSYRPFDGTNFGNTTTVLFNVTPVNDPPVGLAENYATATDQTLVVPAATGVLANDTDIDSATLTAVLVGNVANGTLVFNPDGSFTYTANAGFVGGDSFTYRASDGQAESNLVTVSINVTAVNTPPTANDDAYQVEENFTLQIVKSGAIPPQQVFFSNFNTGVPPQFTGSGASAGVQGYGDVGTGTNTFSGNFLRSTADNGNGSGPATPITLTLTNLPAHTSVDINFLLAIIDSWNGSTGLGSPDFLNVSVDGATIFSESFDTANSQDQSYSSPSGVRLVDGEPLGFSGGGNSVDSAYDMYLEPRFKSIPHTASTLTIAWFASGQGWGGGTDESFAIDNVSIILNVDETNEVALIPAGSVWRYLDDGSNQGTAWREPGYNDSAWSSGPAELGYGDAGEGRPEATVVSFGGDAANKHITTYFRHSFNLFSASAITSLKLELLRDDGAAVYLNGVEIARDNLPENAAFDTRAFGAIPNFDESQFFPFDVDRSLLVSGTNVIAVEVHQNDPTSSDLSFDLRLIATEASDLGILANDVDLEGSQLSAQLVDDVDHGMLTLNPDGTFSYTPNANYHGTDSFTYRASDGFLTSNVATVTITILPGPNEPAVAVNDVYAATEDTTLTVSAGVGVLVNDSDLDDDPLIAELVAQASGGIVVLFADGSFSYTPNADFFGADSFTYRIYDGTDYSNVATVTLNVAGTNDVPVAVNDHYFAELGGQLTVSADVGVVANDRDIDQQGLTAALVANPAHGSLTFNGDGSFVYTPNPTYRGPDSFTYRVSDNDDTSNIATVSLTVDSTPVANNDSYTIAEEGTLNVSVGQGVLINDSDADLDPLTAVLVTGPANGVLSFVSNGSFTYTPNVDFNGQDTFTYRANDGDQLSNIATVTITVTPVNDAPVAVADSYTLFANDTSVVSAANGVLANDFDVDGPALSAMLMVDVSHGTLMLNPDGSFTYTPAVDFVGTDTFIYSASDGSLLSSAVMVTLTVNPASQLIIINEIMYHPQSENDAEEWIELYNTGSSNVNLAGWQFTNGVSYTFPAGPQTVLAGKQYLVVAADVPTFLARYPGFSGTVIGGWTGSLSNSGETVDLSDASGERVDRVEYSDQGDWATRVVGPLSNNHRGWAWEALHDGGGRTLELINPDLSNNQAHNWDSSTNNGGTPGAANSIASPNIAPMISDVMHSPAVPRPTDPVTITARLRDELETGVTAAVFYRVSVASPGPFTQVIMFDDGQHGDGVAGDGVYGAVIPPQGPDAVIEFFLRSQDLGGNLRTYPMANDNGSQVFPRLLYQVDDEVWTGEQPIYRIVMSVPESNEFQNINRNSNAQMNATFVAVRGSETAVRYNLGVRVRGASSRDRNPPGLRVNVPHDRPWSGKTSFNLNTQYTWLQTLGGALFQVAGLPGFTATPVQVRMNSANLATNNPQAGSYVHVEVIDNEWANDQLPEDDQGNVYTKRRPDNRLAYRGSTTAPYYTPASIQGYLNDGWEKKTNESENDWSDLNEMLRVLNQVDPAPGVSYFDRLNAIIDVDQWTRYFALMVLMNSRETSISNGADDDYDIYRGVVDPRFILVPHDLDTIFNQGDTGTNPTATIFQPIDASFAGTTLPVFDPFFRDPKIVGMYYGHLRDLIDTVFSQTQLNALIDNLLGGWINNNTINNLKSFADQRRAHVLSLLPTNLTVSSNLPNVGGYPMTTNPAIAALSGVTNAAQTRKVLVAGNEVNWDAFNRAWSTTGATASTDTLIPFGATWRYLDNGTNQGVVWRDPAFNDAGWATGPAELGYGDGDEATVVNCGPSAPQCNQNNFITTYFRRTFSVPNPSQYSSLTLRFRRDDGIAIYINGTEVARNNLAPDAPFDQGASNATDDGSSIFDIVNIPVGLLTPGNNVIAAEVHQQNASSSDVTFDLSLLGLVPAPGATIPLQPGINRVLVQALGEGNVELERQTIDIWYDDGTVVDVSGSLPGNATWSAANGPYRVTGNLTVPVGTTLTIQPGTSVYFEPGTSLTVNGRLVASGTELSRIFMGRTPGSSGSWNGITFSNTTQLNQMSFVDMFASDGSGQSIAAVNSSITLDRMTWSGVNSTVLELTNSSFRVMNSVFPSLSGTADDEVVHGNGILAGGVAILDGNTFGTVSGYNDVVDFTGGKRPGPILQVLNNTFLGGSDDALDLDGTDAHIEGNTFRNFHKNNASDSSSNAIATGINNGVASEITVVRNFFYDNDHAVLVKEGSYLTLQNNTIVGSTIAAINFDEPNRPVQPGLGALVEGNIFSSNAADFANVYDNHPTEGTTQLTINYSLVAAAYLNRGVGNLDAATNDARIANAANGDFSLAPGSAAKGTGPAGIDMGGAVPRWSAVGGEPIGTTPSTSASLFVYGPGVLSYFFRLDAGAWSTERSVSTPIELTGLSAGSHVVQVVSRNSAGQFQGFAAPSSSSIWTVDPTAPSIRINEVLALNSTAMNHEGTYPDAIELYNFGSAAVDIGGWTLTDDPTSPTKYTIPLGTMIGAGEYLVIFADSATTSGLHAGFALSATGESVSLYRSAAQGGGLVDTVAFGIQLADFSIGRDSMGAWSLNQPTLGAANVVQRTGDPRRLRINEWLAASNRLFLDDRLELYNPDSLPVNMGGLWLTDNPIGRPANHQIASLSYVAGNGYAAFIPDNETDLGADHLSFALNANYEMIALLDSNLTLLDQVLFMSQHPDVSEGRLPDGQLLYSFISPPNIGLPNSTVLSVNDVLDYLRITEIQYNPVGAGDNDEFIELKNIGPVTLNLDGVIFRNGIDFAFPAMTLAPGAFVVVVADLAAFEAKHGTGINVAGVYSGRLDNSGENIELFLGGYFEAEIQDFTYDDAWYPTTDGGGPSLVIKDPTGPLDSWRLASAWRPSGTPFGSPGADDPTDGIPPTVSQVIVASSTWTGPFVTQLDILGLGQGGYRVPMGAGQLAPLPWSNLDTITIVFSEPVNVTADALSAFGVSAAQYPTTTFSVDGTRATWRLANPISADKVNLTLPGTITDGAGNPLAAFSFRMDVLAGDVNRDGVVSAADLATGVPNMFAAAGAAGYNPLHDINGDGRTSFTDSIVVRNRLGTALPAGSPSGSPAAPAAIFARAAVRSQAADAALETLAVARTRVRALGRLSTDTTRRDAANAAASGGDASLTTSTLRARRARTADIASIHDEALTGF